jgi:hypothetical protein
MGSVFLYVTSAVRALCATSSFVIWSFRTGKRLFLGNLLYLKSIGLLATHAYYPSLKQGMRRRVYQIPSRIN